MLRSKTHTHTKHPHVSHIVFIKLKFNSLTTGNFRIWVLLQVGIKYRITDLITHFICKERSMKSGVTYNLQLVPYLQICNVLPVKILGTIFTVIYTLVG
jgi:hypothetical protein